MSKRVFTSVAYIVAISMLFACTGPVTVTETDEPVAVSFTGNKFYEPQRSAKEQSRLDSLLQIAKTDFENDPSEENYIWYGRREGYLMHLREAVSIFTQGLEKYPESYRLYRHRGHRYISLREFDKAIADFEKAAQLMEGAPLEIEPDGIPNKLNQPLSTTQFNVWYHLGLAHYLKKDFPKAEDAYKKCLAVSDDDDSRIAVIDWLYMTYRRQGKTVEAASLLDMITDSMTVIENDSYYSRLKMYKSWLKPEELLSADTTSDDYDLTIATQGYGVGNWYLYNGDSTKAYDTFQKVVDGKLFAAFGFIAAEAELANR